MALFCAASVNAYKRLKPAQLAGDWANWGYDHRGVTIRIPHERGGATRIENRMSDGAASPYLATVAVLQAAHLLSRRGRAGLSGKPKHRPPCP